MDQATHLYPVPAEFAAQARVDARRYAADYARSVSDPPGFWGEVGRRVDWIRPYTQVKDVSYRLEDFHIRWYEDGTLNVAHNCLDRHLSKHGDRVAIIWEGDRPGESRQITYRELHADVCRFGNVLRELGVRKGIASQSICR
jgi:acetyl-CoA synthetase